MWRTAGLSLLAALLAYATGAWLTLDFEVWTAEGARRLAVARVPVPAPATMVHGPGIDSTALPALLVADGRVTVLDFIYTRCQTVCLALGGSFQQMQSALLADLDQEAAGARGVRLLSIGFDPVHDTPAALAAYAARLRADPRVWRFATPVQTVALHALLERFEVVVIDDGMGGYDHNAALLVFDRRGRLVRIFDYDETQSALAFARQLAARGAGG